jgi:hypothetical protein
MPTLTEVTEITCARGGIEPQMGYNGKMPNMYSDRLNKDGLISNVLKILKHEQQSQIQVLCLE